MNNPNKPAIPPTHPTDLLGCVVAFLCLALIPFFMLYSCIKHPFLPAQQAVAVSLGDLPPGYIIEKNAGGYYRCVNTNVSENTYNRYPGFPQASYTEAVEDAWNWHNYYKDEQNRRNNNWTKANQ